MSIVAEKAGSVNIPNEIIDNAMEKWTEKKIASRRMAVRLFRSGLQGRAARMYNCADYVTTRIAADTGEIRTDTALLCRDRLCAVCAWRLSLRRFSEMMSVMQTLQNDVLTHKYAVSMLTLTVRNVPVTELRRCIDSFSKAWHNMSRRALFSGCVGWSRSLEITYNAEADTYHPHYHCILIWQKEDTSALAADVMRAAWRHAYGADYSPIIDIRPVYSRENTAVSSVISGALEAFKYSVKPDTLRKLPDSELRAFAEAISSVRMVSYGRAIKEARKALGYTNDDMAQPIDTASTLPDSAIIALMRWNGTAYTKTALEAIPWNVTKERLEYECRLADEDMKEAGTW